MKTILVFASTALLASGCAAQNNADRRTDANVPADATVSVPSGSGKDDYVAMQEELNFSAEQKAAFEKKLAERNAAYDAWEKSPSGQKYLELNKDIANSKAAGNTDRVAKLQAEKKPLQQERDAVRIKARREVDTVLTLEQQKLFAGYNLNKKVLSTYSRLNLTDEQQKQIRIICNALAVEAVTQDTIKSDPFLLLTEDVRNKALTRASAEVLTPVQRSRIPTTRPGKLA